MDEPQDTPGSALSDLFGSYELEMESQVMENYVPQVTQDPADRKVNGAPCGCELALEGSRDASRGSDQCSVSLVNKCCCGRVNPTCSHGDLTAEAHTTETVLRKGQNEVGGVCISATSDSDFLLYELQDVIAPKDDYRSPVDENETVSRTALGDESTSLFEPHDRSDGSDSGLGSELAEDLAVPVHTDCSIDDLCSQITRHVSEQSGLCFLNEDSEMRPTEMQPQAVANPILSKSEANSVETIDSNPMTVDDKAPTSDYDTQTETSEQSLDEDSAQKLPVISNELGLINLLNMANDKNGLPTDVGEVAFSPKILDREAYGMGNMVFKEQSACSVDNVERENEDTSVDSERRVIRSTLKRAHSESNSDEPKPKKKKSISFDSVCVYYFPRTQGFTCVPSQGGSTLGMAREHSHVHRFSIVEHAVEQRRVHRQMMLQLRHDRLSQTTAPATPPTTGATAAPVSSSEDSDSEEEPSDASESELDVDSYYFLQPVPTRQRRALLRAAGVHRIDSVEKDECRDIRTSRELCGCACKTYCDPDSCSCSQSGIKCQVDRVNFPCGCSRDGCANTSGRIEFNPIRVRTHFIHTLMRLELEKKQGSVEEAREQASWHCAVPTPTPAALTSCEGAKLNGQLHHNANVAPTADRTVQSGSLAGPSDLGDGPGPGPGPGPGSEREDPLDLYPFSEKDSGTNGSQTLPYSSLRKPMFAINPETVSFSQDPFSTTSSCDVHTYSYSNTSNLNQDSQYGRQQFSGFPLFSNPLPSVCGLNYSPQVYNQDLGFKSQIENFENGDYLSQTNRNNNGCYENFSVENVAGQLVPEGDSSKSSASPSPAAAAAAAAPCAESAEPAQAVQAVSIPSHYTNLYPVCHKVPPPLTEQLSEPLLSGLLQGRYPYLPAPGVATSVPSDAVDGPALQQPCGRMPVGDLFHRAVDPESDAPQQVQQGPSRVAGHADHAQLQDKTDDCDENFGEIIKKTMVETVSA